MTENTALLNAEDDLLRHSKRMMVIQLCALGVLVVGFLIRLDRFPAFVFMAVIIYALLFLWMNLKWQSLRNVPEFYCPSCNARLLSAWGRSTKAYKVCLNCGTDPRQNTQ